MLVPTLRLCTPSISAAAISPVSSGSSEKYSKLRPHRGLRLMLAAGPSSTPTDSARHSSPKASPICRKSAGSKLQAVAAAVGKQVASTEAFSPRWSASPACLRRPWGPSVTIKDCTPSRSTALVSQKILPEHSDAFSSSVICATSSAAFFCHSVAMTVCLPFRAFSFILSDTAAEGLQILWIDFKKSRSCPVPRRGCACGRPWAFRR